MSVWFRKKEIIPPEPAPLADAYHEWRLVRIQTRWDQPSCRYIQLPWDTWELQRYVKSRWDVYYKRWEGNCWVQECIIEGKQAAQRTMKCKKLPPEILYE